MNRIHPRLSQSSPSEECVGEGRQANRHHNSVWEGAVASVGEEGI